MNYDNTSFKSIFKRLIKYHVLPYKSKMMVAVFCMIIVAITSTFQVWLVKPALDKIFLNKNSNMLNLIPIIVIIVAVIRGVAAYFQNYLMKYIGQKVVTEMQVKLYTHLLKSDLAFLHNYSTGKIITKFTNDINIMRASVSNVLTGMVRESLTVLFLVILMFYQSPTLSLIAFTVFPLAILPIIKMGKRMRKISHSTQEQLGSFAAKLDDSFQLIKVVKSYCGEEFEKSRAKKIIDQLFALYIKAIRTESFSSPIMEALSGIAIGAVIWYGGVQVINGTTTAGSFFSFIVAFISAYKPLKGLADLNSNLQEGLSAAKRIFALLDTKPQIFNHHNAIDLKFTEGIIKFQNVKFVYPNGKEAIDNISLKIPTNKTIAFVGASGGGKSTIVNLLLRFYDVLEGEILLDNHNIKNISLESLRSHISLVTQETALFDDTILANISYGKSNVTYEEIENAAREAYAHDFILELPQAYHTIVGQHGLRLSGGQRQRIALARAILKDAKILILDEATSALDNNSERLIQDSLRKLRNNKTIIIIAHRLSTIIDADLIYVIKDGKIIEQGTHMELLATTGEYAELYSKER